MLIKYIATLHLISKQSKSSQVNIPVCISYSVNSNAHTTPVKIYHNGEFCAVDIFWNITPRQAISPIAKFHHVLGPCFMIDFYQMTFSQSESTI